MKKIGTRHVAAWAVALALGASHAHGQDIDEVLGWIEQGRAMQAVQAIERAEPETRAKTQWQLLEAFARAKAGDTERAQAILEALTRRVPDTRGVWENLAVIRAARNDLEGALESAREAVRRHPGESSWNTLGDVHVALAERAYEGAHEARRAAQSARETDAMETAPLGDPPKAPASESTGAAQNGEPSRAERGEAETEAARARKAEIERRSEREAEGSAPDTREQAQRVHAEALRPAAPQAKDGDGNESGVAEGAKAEEGTQAMEAEAPQATPGETPPAVAPDGEMAQALRNAEAAQRKPTGGTEPARGTGLTSGTTPTEGEEPARGTTPATGAAAAGGTGEAQTQGNAEEEAAKAPAPATGRASETAQAEAEQERAAGDEGTTQSEASGDTSGAPAPGATIAGEKAGAESAGGTPAQSAGAAQTVSGDEQVDEPPGVERVKAQQARPKTQASAGEGADEKTTPGAPQRTPPAGAITAGAPSSPIERTESATQCTPGRSEQVARSDEARALARRWRSEPDAGEVKIERAPGARTLYWTLLAKGGKAGYERAKTESAQALGDHAQIVRGARYGRISFGLFAKAANARRRAETLAELGVKTEIVEERRDAWTVQASGTCPAQ